MKWGALDMQSKTSLIKREILKMIFRSVGWVTIVYFLGLFFAIPLDIIMNTSVEQRQYLAIDNLFKHNFQLQFILSLSVPVILSVFLFRFTQVKQYSDLMHSLPLKRVSIFHQYALTGIMLLILPVLLIALVVLALYQPFNLQDFYSVGEIIKWAGATLLFNILLYMAGVSVGMLTGLSAVQGVLTYIFLLLPVSLVILVSINLPFYLFGFPDQYYMASKFEKFSPLISITQMNERTPSIVETAVYLILIVCLYVLGLQIYKRRKMEAVKLAPM
jgi:ABC-2 type transport system permease protein